MTEATADAWMAASASQAAVEGRPRDAAYFDAMYEWVAAERDRRASP
jgi:hypothetical protein